MVQTLIGSNELLYVPLGPEQPWQPLMTQLPVHLVLSLIPGRVASGKQHPLHEISLASPMWGQEPRPRLDTTLCWVPVCPVLTDGSSQSRLYLAHRPTACILQIGRKGDFSSPSGAGEHVLRTFEHIWVPTDLQERPTGVHSLPHLLQEGKHNCPEGATEMGLEGPGQSLLPTT